MPRWLIRFGTARHTPALLTWAQISIGSNLLCGQLGLAEWEGGHELHCEYSGLDTIFW